MREFPAGDDAAQREAHVLGALDGLDGLAPRLLAAAGQGASSERQCVLISRLPGRANVTPGDPHRWAAELGEALARIHATPVQPTWEFESVFARPGGSPANVAGPAAALVEAGANHLRGARLSSRTTTSGRGTCSGRASGSAVSWTGRVPRSNHAGSTSAGAVSTCTCSSTSGSQTCFGRRTNGRSASSFQTGDYSTSGRLRAHTRPLSSGSRTTAASGGPISPPRFSAAAIPSGPSAC